MRLPVVAVTRPHDLVNAVNGRLPGSLLETVHGGGGKTDRLHPRAAEAWDALSDEAWQTGIELSFTGCYRDYVGQVTLFRSRYRPGRFGSTRWLGQSWRHVSGPSAAVPGTSQHGWGLAVDLAEVVDGQVVSLTATTIAWLCAHGHMFGWSAELQSEPWHWHYFAGDDVPPLVIALRTPPATPMSTPSVWTTGTTTTGTTWSIPDIPPLPAPLPPPSTPAPLTMEDDMRLVIGDGPGRDQDPVLTAEQNVTGNGYALCVLGPTGKTWVKSAAADTAYRTVLGEPVRLPQATLDAIPLVAVTH